MASSKQIKILITIEKLNKNHAWNSSTQLSDSYAWPKILNLFLIQYFGSNWYFIAVYERDRKTYILTQVRNTS